MTELTCQEVRQDAAEFALGILESQQRAAVAAHLLRCPACREEADDLYTVGARLLDLVPGTEPPLGFDRRALAAVGSRPSPVRLRFRMVATVAAAALIAVGTAFGANLTHSTRPHPAILAAAEFRQSSHAVGELYIYKGQPPWLVMTVRSLSVKPADGWVICELVHRNGSVTELGSFQLVRDSGSWGAPDPAGTAGVTGARLLDDEGHLLATAKFT